MSLMQMKSTIITAIMLLLMMNYIMAAPLEASRKAPVLHFAKTYAELHPTISPEIIKAIINQEKVNYKNIHKFDHSSDPFYMDENDSDYDYPLNPYLRELDQLRPGGAVVSYNNVVTGHDTRIDFPSGTSSNVKEKTMVR